MNKIDYLKHIVSKLTEPNNESIKMSLNNVHHNGLFSLVVDGNEFGKLLRIFIADVKLKPFEVQLHTHRYPIIITSIKGQIKQHIAYQVSDKEAESVNMNMYNYKSFLNGGKGLEYIYESTYKLNEFFIPNGSSIYMGTHEFHTISCTKGSIWIVEEKGFEREHSKVLGIPFVTDNLYQKPEMFQINDKIQIVLRELKQIIKDYESVL